MRGRGRSTAGLAVVCAVLFLTFLDNTVVSVILVGIQSSLHAGVTTVQWVVDAYMVTFAGLMLTGGTLGDLLGRKRVMLAGAAIFSAGSAVAMLAPSGNVLIAARVVMGLGAAASEPGTLSMIRHLYDDRQRRARALGAWAAVSGAALALGPVIGGAIMGATSWREVFAFGVAFGMVAFVWGAIVLPENADPEGRQVDAWGLTLGIASIAAGTTGVIEGETAGYGTWWIDLLFAVAIGAALVLVEVERHRRDPVLKLEFFRHPTFSGANLVAFCTNFGVFAIFFFTAFYLELIGSFSGYTIALSFLAMAAAMIAVAPLAGFWVARHGPKLPTVVGCTLAGAGILVVQSVLSPSVSAITLAWSLAIVGLGFGMTLVTMTSSVLTIVPARRSGMAASTMNTFRELGGVFSVAGLGAIVNAKLTSHLATRLRQLGIPPNFRAIVIRGVTHGGTANAPRAKAAAAGHAKLVHEVLSAAYQAFGSGLHVALIIAGSMLLVAGAAAALLVRRPTGGASAGDVGDTGDLDDLPALASRSAAS